MKKYMLLLIFPALLVSCKAKKVSLSGEEPVDRQEFVDFFTPVKLPYQLNDDSLQQKEPDSLAIAYSVFGQFVQDSVLSKHFAKNVHPHLYALGKAVAPKAETYLFLKAVASGRKIIYVLCFGKSGKFLAAKPLLVADNRLAAKDIATMDAKYTITLRRQRKDSEGQIKFRQYTYAFDGGGAFPLILTESNESTPEGQPIINPIDTLPHHRKFSGDYVQDPRNFVSVRDGRESSRMTFFVHFEKDKGSCKGELKGTARFTGSNSAQYRSMTDPCTLEFSFHAESVSIHELDGCGSHRDIKCFFEGTYLRKKELHARHSGKMNNPE